VAFAGPQWRELFTHVCREAERLGLEVNMNNDAGWTGSAGPWVPPELSMQKIVWSETIVAGGRSFAGVLPQPPTLMNHYRDVAVLAYPTPPGEEKIMRDAAPKFSTSGTSPQPGWFAVPKPDDNRPEYVQVEFAQPFTARTCTAMFSGRRPVHGSLQTSDDGVRFKPVQPYAVTPPYLSLTFKPVTARFFRLVIAKLPHRSQGQAGIEVYELELSPRPSLDQTLRKAMYNASQFPPAPAGWSAPAGLSAIRRDQMVDLSARMNAAGRLTWDPPPGTWTVVRFGHTSTGRDNHPSPESGRGLECDKLSKEAAKVMFAGFIGRLVAENQPRVGPGKTLVSTHIDSWEVGSQNWTPRMREEFRQRRGYDLTRLLPAFMGRVVDHVEVTERFLWDLRQTISDLVVENYAGEFRRLARQHGLRLSIEGYSNVPADEQSYAGQADEPMGEFWSWKKFAAGNSCTQMASVGHTYGKTIIGAEAFTATWDEKWLGHPGNIKEVGDWAFCEGINRLVFHCYAAQPWLDRAPGMTMGHWGLHYERTQTWWEQSKAWHEYLARCQFLLRQGLFVADVAYLQPEGSPRRLILPDGVEIAPQIRGGYNFDGCSAEVVLARMTVKAGRLVLPDGMSYRVLVVPPTETMTPRLLRRLKELSGAGANLLVDPSPPRASPSLADRGAGDAEVKTLAAELWPRLASGQTAAQWLAGQGVPPDFSATPQLRYLHRTTSDAEIYFVANPEARTVEAAADFRVSGGQAELWWPESGKVSAALAYEERSGITRLPLRLEPHGSVFVVFRRAARPAERIRAVARDGRPVWSGVGAVPGARSAGATEEFPACDLSRGEIWQSGSYEFESSSGQKRGFEVALPPAQEVAGPWEVRFDPKLGPFDAASSSSKAGADTTGWRPGEFVFAKLDDWSKRAEPGIKYYSGPATYRKVFSVPPSDRGHRTYLDLGQVAVMAEVRLNGKNLGTLWKPPYRIDVTDALARGENTLEIKVVNLWINRLIGDEQLPEDSDREPAGTLKSWPNWVADGRPSPTGRFTFTTWRHWKKDDPLVQSGLLGPVTLRAAARIPVQSQP
jgi:hypothetical protein